MKMKEIDFRTAYHNFFYISGQKIIHEAAEQFPDSEKSDGALVYGYIDHEAGLSFELICCVRKSDDNLEFFEGNDTATVKFRAGSIKDCDAIYIDKERNADLLEKYSKKTEIIHKYYDDNDGVAYTRKIDTLDSNRHPWYPDDVKVIIIHGDNQPEGCWVRCEGVTENAIFGVLLNEPDQDMNVHQGDMVYFGILKQDDNFICVAQIE